MSMRLGWLMGFGRVAGLFAAISIAVVAQEGTALALGLGEPVSLALGRVLVPRTGPDLVGPVQPRLGDANQVLWAFYANRDYRPLWSDEHGVKPNAELLVKTLTDIGREGLDPNRFSIAALTAKLEAAKQEAAKLEAVKQEAAKLEAARQEAAKQEAAKLGAGKPEVSKPEASKPEASKPEAGKAGVLGPDSLAELDRDLSRALLQYGALLHGHGGVLPSDVHPSAIVSAMAGLPVPPPFDSLGFLEAATTAPDFKAFLEAVPPARPEYVHLREGLAAYRSLEAKGGWPVVPGGPKLIPGMDDPRVPVLRQRLRLVGDLAGNTDDRSTHFDETLAQGVRAFQSRHGLTPDGNVDPQTLQVLNVPIADRIRQIRVNL
ncbi:MAG: peptidoglycan-binding protein, partial [Alphaproteobacteria bacterium]|nr:peptidoglycan-binding protein [Alphaproteobacteria bacterium]